MTPSELAREIYSETNDRRSVVIIYQVILSLCENSVVINNQYPVHVRSDCIIDCQNLSIQDTVFEYFNNGGFCVIKLPYNRLQISFYEEV